MSTAVKLVNKAKWWRGRPAARVRERRIQVVRDAASSGLILDAKHALEEGIELGAILPEDIGKLRVLINHAEARNICRKELSSALGRGDLPRLQQGIEQATKLKLDHPVVTVAHGAAEDLDSAAILFSDAMARRERAAEALLEAIDAGDGPALERAWKQARSSGISATQLEPYKVFYLTWCLGADPP